MKRFYDAMFYFDCGAALAVVILAGMWDMPELGTAALWFAFGAVAFWLAAKQVK